MFNTDVDGFHWLSSPSGRSKRTTVVKTGCYVLEHDATGKLLTGVSDHVSFDVDLILITLKDESCKNKAFVKLCQGDPAVRVYEYPAKNLKHAKLIEKGIRSTTIPTYLLLN